MDRYFKWCVTFNNSSNKNDNDMVFNNIDLDEFADDKERIIQFIEDDKILGGLIVQIGSKMIDSSLLTRLKLMQSNMNEV